MENRFNKGDFAVGVAVGCLILFTALWLDGFTYKQRLVHFPCSAPVNNSVDKPIEK